MGANEKQRTPHVKAKTATASPPLAAIMYRMSCLLLQTGDGQHSPRSRRASGDVAPPPPRVQPPPLLSPPSLRRILSRQVGVVGDQRRGGQ